MDAGILVRKSEAPGGCGWIVDFGSELGRQFFATGGASNVCHLAFAHVRSSPSSPAAASPVRSPVGLQASPSQGTQWVVQKGWDAEGSLMSLIGTSARLKQQSCQEPPQDQHVSNSIQMDIQRSSTLASTISDQVASLTGQVRLGRLGMPHWHA